MRISLTLESKAGPVDVCVDLDDATPIEQVAAALGSAVGVANPSVQVTPKRISGAPAEPAERTGTVADLGLRNGARVGLDGPVTERSAVGTHGLQLHVVGGPGAGAIFALPLGTHEIGRHSAYSWRDGTLSRQHARLTVGSDVLTIEDLESRNGTFVDGDRITSATPIELDQVVGVGDSLITVRAARDLEATVESREPGWLDFLRPPRISPWHAPAAVDLPKAPAGQTKRRLPVIEMVAPLVIGVVMAILMNPLFLAMAMMAPVMVMAKFVSDRRSDAKKAREAAAEYEEQLADAQTRLSEAVSNEQARVRHELPDAAETFVTCVLPGRRLWERRRGDGDVLHLRVGSASLASTVKVSGAEKAPEELLKDVPVAFDLPKQQVVGVAGPSPAVDGILRWLVTQAAAYHSRRDLTMSFLSLHADAEWSWLRWLPHLRDDPSGAVAMVGNNEETVVSEVARLTSMISARREAAREAGAHRVSAESFPAHVVVLHGYRGLRGILGLDNILENGPSVGIYAICTEASERSLPERCTATVVLDAAGVFATLRRSGQPDVPKVLTDQVASEWCDRVARELSPLRDVGAQSEAGALPDTARFLDIVDLEPPTPAVISSRWARQARSTAMTIGVGMDGPFTLDLRGDGPHGLIAGMTGSGKTELLQTIIASLAVANRPEWLNFVLIDYKGDSAFKDCVDLPHTVGKVNDLDSYLVERALASLEAELDVRKKVLADAGVKDIEDYHDLHTKEPWRDPLPRLVLVIDEFAELAKELPDFMEGLVSIAQVGRSLGVHLLLATQRPSGVVSPKIRANTNMRIALRVADSSDSTDILQSPEAASIPKSAPGRAYARLGAGMLRPFQSGRVGGRRPGSVAVDLPAPFVARVDWSALGYAAPTPVRATGDQEVSDTDLRALVAAVSDAAEAEGISAQRQPWLDPVPAHVLWGDHVEGEARRGEVPPLPWGRSDVPSQQRQITTVFDLDRDGHLFFVGSPKTGRSQVLRTIAGSIARLTDPSDVHVYGIDCGSGALNPIAALPHCGAVVGRSETERATRLLTRLAAEVDSRQRALAAHGYSDVSEQRARDTAPLPYLVVLLDRWEGFAATLGKIEGVSEIMLKLVGEGASAGVHLVVTGDRSLVFNSRVGVMTENKWAFRLADKSDFSLVGMFAKQVPDRLPPGRCFGPGGLETQVLLLSDDASGQGQAAAIKALAEDAQASVGPDPVRPFRVDVLPERITLEEALTHRSGATTEPYLLVGVGGDELTAFAPDITRSTSFIVAGPGRSGRSTILLGAARSVLATGGEVVVVAPRPSPLRDLAGVAGVLGVFTDTMTTSEELDALLATATGPVVIAIDDAEGARDVPANDVFMRVVKGQQPGVFLLLGGHTDGVGAGLMGWQVEAKKARQGLLLSPQGLSDGDVVGVRVTRDIIGKPVQPGRGWLHLGDGELVQVATVVG